MKGAGANVLRGVWRWRLGWFRQVQGNLHRLQGWSIRIQKTFNSKKITTTHSSTTIPLRKKRQIKMGTRRSLILRELHLPLHLLIRNREYAITVLTNCISLGRNSFFVLPKNSTNQLVNNRSFMSAIAI